MVFGVIGVIIQIVLLLVVMVYKHEHEYVMVKWMEDNHVMVHLHKQFHVIQMFLVQVRNPYLLNNKKKKRLYSICYFLFFKIIVDGQWTTWSQQSPCSATCGTGYVRLISTLKLQKTCIYSRRLVHVHVHKFDHHLVVLYVLVLQFFMNHVQLHKTVQVYIHIYI